MIESAPEAFGEFAWKVKVLLEDSVIMMSDALRTINTQSMEEYKLIQGGGKKRALQAIEKDFRETVISPELIKRVIEQVEEKFRVKIHFRKDRPIIETAFNTSKLKPYGKLYEIEKHAKALAEAWSRIKRECKA